MVEQLFLPVEHFDSVKLFLVVLVFVLILIGRIFVVVFLVVQGDVFNVVVIGIVVFFGWWYMLRGRVRFPSLAEIGLLQSHGSLI